jgi:drug/metabolite transporter (DMT)-like permease
VGVVLALLTAVSYGAGDYAGGRATRLAPVWSVTASSHLLGLIGLTVVAAIVGADEVRAVDLVIGAGAGCFGLLGVVFLYRGLAGGSMAVVSPVSGVVAAVVPVITGLVSGERPGGLALAGVAIALVAILLVTRSGPVGAVSRESVVVAVGAGIGFGVFFVFIGAIAEAAGLWPLVAGRTVSAGLSAVVALAASHPIVPPRPARLFTLAAGALDVAANVTFLLATQHGLLTIVAVIASLYPAATVLLALTIDGERLRRVQVAGLGLAGASITLCAV